MARALLLIAAGCGRSIDDPLPPQTDLYAYSLAVIERAASVCDSSEMKPLLAMARVHENFGMLQKALELYRRAASLHNSSAEAYRRIGFILSQGKDSMEAALEAYEAALRIDPTAPGVPTRVGLVLTHLNRLPEAVRMLESEVEAGTADADTYYNLGQAQALEGNHGQAVISYREALKSAPGMRMTHYSLAQSLRLLGQVAEADAALKEFQRLKAEEDAQAARAKAPTDARKEHLRHASQAWMDAADIFSEAGTSSQDSTHREFLERQFLSALQEAKRIDPSHAEPYTVIAQYYSVRKQTEPAARTLIDGLAQAQDPSPLVPLAFTVVEQCLNATSNGKDGGPLLELGLRLLENVVQLEPEMAAARQQLAWMILSRLQDRAELQPVALEHARKALEIEPTSERVDILAYALFRVGRVPEAKEVLIRGLAQFPDSPQLKERLRVLEERLRGANPGSQLQDSQHP